MSSEDLPLRGPGAQLLSSVIGANAPEDTPPLAIPTLDLPSTASKVS